MNKWIGFPLITMIILLFINIIVGGNLATATTSGSGEYSGDVVVNGNSSSVSVNGGSYTFELASAETILIILSTAIAVCIVASIYIVGSGINESGNELILKSIGYGGLWTCLTVFCATLITDLAIVGVITYSILTMSYVIGFIADIKGV